MLPNSALHSVLCLLRLPSAGPEGALVEPCWSLVQALGWLCSGYRLAFNKPRRRFEVALMWPWGGLAECRR